MEGFIKERPVQVMIDGGAGTNFISEHCLKRLQNSVAEEHKHLLVPTHTGQTLTVRLADGSTHVCGNSLKISLHISTYKQTNAAVK